MALLENEAPTRAPDPTLTIPSFYTHDTRVWNPILAPSERRSSVTLAQKMKTLGIIVGALVALWGLRWVYVQVFGTDEFEYRGHTIKMSRKYVDYDAFKDDADNILESELPKLEQLIVEAKLSGFFRDWTTFVRDEFELKVPGYGMGGGPNVRSSGREFLVSSVEIPTRPPAEKFRYFVLEKFKDGSLKMVDDFVEAGFPRLAEVEYQDGTLVYRSKSGAIVREKKIAPAEPVDPDQRP